MRRGVWQSRVGFTSPNGIERIADCRRAKQEWSQIHVLSHDKSSVVHAESGTWQYNTPHCALTRRGRIKSVPSTIRWCVSNESNNSL